MIWEIKRKYDKINIEDRRLGRENRITEKRKRNLLKKEEFLWKKRILKK